MKNLEFKNCNVVELDSNEITKIDGGYASYTIFDCIYSIPKPKIPIFHTGSKPVIEPLPKRAFLSMI